MAMRSIFQGSEGTTNTMSETSAIAKSFDTVDGFLYPIDLGFSP